MLKSRKLQLQQDPDKNEDYTCWKCGHRWKDDLHGEPYACPRCGSFKITLRVK